MNTRELAALNNRVRRFTEEEADAVDATYRYWLKDIKSQHILAMFKHLPEFDNNIFMQAIEEVNDTPPDEYSEFIDAILYRAAQLKAAYEIEHREAA